jgi:hypothetical protein
VHGEVPILLNTSVAAGISGTVSAAPRDLVLRNHPVVGAASEQQEGVLRIFVNTRRLRSNRVVALQALIYVGFEKACSLRFRLMVDNIPPRLLLFRTATSSQGRLVTLKVSENSRMQIVGGGRTLVRGVLVPAGKTIHATLPRRIRHARLILRDRANNKLTRQLNWG